MAKPNDGSRSHLQKLREQLHRNRRLVSEGQDLLSQIDQGFAAVKDQKKKLRRTNLPAVQEPAGSAPPTENARRRILLVEDHPVVSRGLAELINYEPDFQVVGLAEDVVSALNQVKALRPDLVLMDLSLKEKNGLELLKDIKNRFARQRVLILSLHDETIYAPRALRAGASGYVMKEAATETLLAAIRQVLAGEIYLSPAMRAESEPSGISPTASAPHPLQALSDRELDVLRLIGFGRTSREIAVALGVSVKTIESHRTHIRHKLKLKNGTELVQLAIELNQDPHHSTPHPESPAEPTAPPTPSAT